MEPTPNVALDQAQQQPLQVFSEETYVAGSITIESPDPGVPGNLKLKQYIGPLGPGLFITAKVLSLSPDLAVQVGEHLVREGRKARSGLHVAHPGEMPRPAR